MSTAAVDIDALAVTRLDLSSALLPVGLDLYDELPKSTTAPAIIIGRPSIQLYDSNVTRLTWTVIVVANPVTPLESQHNLDAWVWSAWQALGGGAVIRLDQRAFTADSAEPSIESIGDNEYPGYRITVVFDLHSTFCNP